MHLLIGVILHTAFRGTWFQDRLTRCRTPCQTRSPVFPCHNGALMALWLRKRLLHNSLAYTQFVFSNRSADTPSLASRPDLCLVRKLTKLKQITTLRLVLRTYHSYFSLKPLSVWKGLCRFQRCERAPRLKPKTLTVII
jgi:hypothetical protein